MDANRRSIFDLPPAEKLQLVQDLWDDLAATPEAIPVHDWQKAELDRRRKNLLDNPASGLSWEAVLTMVRRRARTSLARLTFRVDTVSTSTIKAEARRLVDQLPEDATWDDLMYEIYVRQAIEAGLKDSDEGRTISVEEVRKRFGLAR